MGEVHDDPDGHRQRTYPLRWEVEAGFRPAQLMEHKGRTHWRGHDDVSLPWLLSGSKALTCAVFVLFLFHPLPTRAAGSAAT